MSREPDAARARAREIALRVGNRFVEAAVLVGEAGGTTTMTVPRDHAIPILEALRVAGFDYLVDVTAHDTLKLEEPGEERFCVHWIVHAYGLDARIHVRAWVPEDDPRVETASVLWKAALWGERECYDMYGIEFDGHPDLRRILMPEDFGAFPLRKDYPLKGRGERDNFPVITRDKA